MYEYHIEIVFENFGVCLERLISTKESNLLSHGFFSIPTLLFVYCHA